MFCPSCGTKCPDNAIACPTCGSVLPGLTDVLRGVPQNTAPRPKPAGITPDDETVLSARSPMGPGPNRGTGRPSGPVTPAAPGRTGTHTGSNANANTANGGTGPQIGGVKLVVEQGRILGEQFLLNDYEIMIGRYDAGSGRCPDIDLTAQDPAYVHRQHVRLAFNRNGDQLMVYDMGGRNGSYLNNQLIEKNGSAVVQLGDKLRVGRVVLRVQSAREGEDDRAAR